MAAPRNPSTTLSRQHVAVRLSKHSKPLSTVPDLLRWRHFAWFIFYIQILLYVGHYGFLAHYNIPEVPRRMRRTFHMKCVEHRCDTLLAFRMFRHMLKPVSPGDFITQAFADNHQCLYYITVLHCYYPFIDILVRDYSQARDINGGFYKAVRLQMDTTNWIERPEIKGRLFVEYVFFRILYFFLRHWTIVPPLGDINIWVRYANVVDNMV